MHLAYVPLKSIQRWFVIRLFVWLGDSVLIDISWLSKNIHHHTFNLWFYFVLNSAELEDLFGDFVEVF